jgi:hypothetical protein
MNHKIKHPKSKSATTATVNHSASETSMPSLNDSDSQLEKVEIEESFPAYPVYPSNEDIYSNFIKEEDMDPEQPLKLKVPVVKSKAPRQLDFWKEMTGEELDIPGADLDDEQEAIGSEDEENNFYSLGGENHHDLDERNDE